MNAETPNNVVVQQPATLVTAPTTEGVTDRVAPAQPPGTDLDAIYEEFDRRAGALKQNELLAVEELKADFALSPLPTYAATPIAKKVQKQTDFDAKRFLADIEKARDQSSAGVATATTGPSHSSLTCDAAWQRCRHLCEAPDLIARLLDIARRLGIAGDKRGLLATFLVGISRLLDNPARMLRKGAAASGKSYVIDVVLKLFNPADYVVMTAGSAKALIYSNRDFHHVLLIIPEAAALVTGKNSGDEFAMMLRELISSGRLNYATVHQDAKGKLVGVVVEKEGPIAFVMTTARENVEEELETRLLVTTADETDDQTKAVLTSIAASAAGTGTSKPTPEELAEWHALQDWLRQGPREVVVPFAPTLAALVHRQALRIRRDFPGMLALVKASALLHRAQRETDNEGRVVATEQDYGFALGAVGDGLEEIIHGETSSIEAVRTVVTEALKRHRQEKRRSMASEAMQAELLAYLKKQKLLAAETRLRTALGKPAGKAKAATIRGCMEIVAAGGSDTALAADPLLTSAVATWRSIAKLARSRYTKAIAAAPAMPSAVEISSQELATALGIQRKAARIRLANAIEAGVVIDMRDSVPNRGQTARLLLAPGTVAVIAPKARRDRRGAFPSSRALQAALAKAQGGGGV